MSRPKTASLACSTVEAIKSPSVPLQKNGTGDYRHSVFVWIARHRFADSLASPPVGYTSKRQNGD